MEDETKNEPTQQQEQAPGAAGKDLQRRGLQRTAGKVGCCHRAAERCEQQNPVVHRNGY